MSMEGGFWDCDCNMSKPALYKFTYSLIAVGGHFTCSMAMGLKGYTPEQNARNTVFFRIWLPKGKEAEFTALSGMKVQTPPRISVS